MLLYKLRMFFQKQYLSLQSYVQYFKCPDTQNIRVVVFGHTHIPKMMTSINQCDLPCFYANTGTWEDRKSRIKSNVIDQDSINMNLLLSLQIRQTIKY